MASVGMERELRNHQQFAINCGECEVHLTGSISKYSQPGDAIFDKFGIIGGIASSNPEQNDKTLPDAPDRFWTDPYLGPAHPLNDCTHYPPSLPRFFLKVVPLLYLT